MTTFLFSILRSFHLVRTCPRPDRPVGLRPQDFGETMEHGDVESFAGHRTGHVGENDD
ncbi:hypothetical protein [Nocardia sp. NPDC051463]|uniref:hypothetical protein n=1 Tax=Nocardia sp. NPDC051463 TaxID=3154845 RepID=UPI00344C8F66